MRRPGVGKTEIDMLNGPLAGPMLRFALPLVLGSLLQLLYNAADVIVVGRFAGSESLAAVGSTGAVSNLMITLLIGLSLGAGVTVAQRRGAGDLEGVRRAVHTLILISLAGGAVFGCAGFFAALPVLRLMNTPDDVIGLAALYMKVIFLGVPVNMLYNFSASILRAIGDTRRPLVYLSVSGLVNVALNLLLVIVFRMGVLGVALATLTSQALSALMTVAYLARTNACVRISRRYLRFDLPSLRMILRIGIPAGLQSAMFSFANTLIQSTVNTFGSVTVAGCAAAANVEGFVYVCQNSFAVTVTNFMGQNVGARKFERAGKVLRTGMLMGAVAGFGVGTAAALSGGTLLRLYTSDAAAVAMGREKLIVEGLTYGLCALMDCYSGALRGMGCSALPMVISLTGSCLLRIVWLNTVFPLAPQIMTVFAAYPVSWGVTTLVYVFFYRRVRGNLLRCGGVDSWGRGAGAAEGAA